MSTTNPNPADRPCDIYTPLVSVYADGTVEIDWSDSYHSHWDGEHRTGGNQQPFLAQLNAYLARPVQVAPRLHAEWRDAFQRWEAERAELSAQEASGDFPHPDDWAESDDWAVDLLRSFANTLGLDQ